MQPSHNHDNPSRRPRLIPVVAGAVILWVLTGGALPINAQAPIAKEYKVKASYLFNFAQFVEWPPAAFADANAPITIGVLGTDEFSPFLDELVRGETIKSRPLVIKRSQKLAELLDCHVLFISKSERDRLDKILPALDQTSVLTVSEVEGFAKRGGVINFILMDGRVRFEINPDAAKHKKLKLGSQLLQLGVKGT